MQNTINKKIIIAFQRWQEENVAYSSHTAKIYFRINLNFIRYMEKNDLYSLNDVNSEKIKEFIHFRKGQLPYSPASIKVREAALHLFFSWAFSQKLVRENPVVFHKRSKINSKNIPLKEFSKKERTLIFLNAKEQKRLLSYMSNANNFFAIRDRCIVIFLLTSGLLIEELIHLAIEDIYLNKGYIEVTHKRKRRVYIDVELCQEDYKKWLKIHPLKTAHRPPLFITQTFSPLSVRALYRIVSEYLQNAGIQKSEKGIGANILRQTAIMNALKKDKNLENIQKNFGIQTYEHIKTYVQDIK